LLIFDFSFNFDIEVTTEDADRIFEFIKSTYQDKINKPGTDGKPVLKFTPGLAAELVGLVLERNLHFGPGIYGKSTCYRFITVKNCAPKKLAGIWQATNGENLKIDRLIDMIRRLLWGQDIEYVNSPVNSSFINSVIDRLPSMERLRIDPAQFDQKRHLLNTPIGTFDLRTGQLQDANPADLFTNITRVAPRIDEAGNLAPLPHPIYTGHLMFVTGNKLDGLNYHRRLSGIVCTGEVLQKFWLFWGHGGNGKGALLKAWSYPLGSFATVAAAGQFSRESITKHKQSDAGLINKRLVASEEVHNLYMEKIKEWTGGSDVKANFMHCNDITFNPQLKLIFVSNILPELNTNDFGLKRRLELDPFDQHIETIDPMYEAKLYAEAEDILATMMLEAKQFYADLAKGLAVLSQTQRMKDAANEYIEQENLAEMFINEQCDRGDECNTIPARTFYTALTEYCVKNALGDPPSKSMVGKQIKALNYGSGRGNDGRFYTGIKWKPGCEPKIGLQSQLDYMHSNN